MQIWELPPSIRLVASSGRRSGGRGYLPHDHPFYELGLVLSGTCIWKLPNQARSLKAGDAILIKPKTLHNEVVRDGEDVRVTWLGFDFLGESPKWSHRVIITGSDFPEVTGYFEILSREHHRPGHVSSAVRVGLAAQSLLLLIARRAEKSPAVREEVTSILNPRQVHCVESAAHYFRTNLADSLSVAQVAAYHSLCPAHFSSLFRTHHGLSPRSFLGKIRVERAMELLKTSDLGLKEIAEECGFVDAAHLCKSFKEARGVTPRAFRLASQ